MEEIKRTVCRELEKFPDKGEISIGELDILYKLVMVKEKLLRIEQIEQEMGGAKNYGPGGNYGDYGNAGNYGNMNYGSMNGNYGNYGTWNADGNYGNMGVAKKRIQELMNDHSISPSEREILRRTLEQM